MLRELHTGYWNRLLVTMSGVDISLYFRESNVRHIFQALTNSALGCICRYASHDCISSS